jgi:hypothetical protein
MGPDRRMAPDRREVSTLETMTRLEGTLRRELVIDDKPFTLAISPEGLKLTRKGRRKGHELRWKDLVSGEAALAVALNASLTGAR